MNPRNRNARGGNQNQAQGRKRHAVQHDSHVGYIMFLLSCVILCEFPTRALSQFAMEPHFLTEDGAG